MAAVLETETTKVKAEQRFVLHDASWGTYEQLLRNYENQSALRFAYDRGELEIMSPSIPHEESSRILSLLVSIICEERTIDVRDLGSTTYRRVELLKGVEPDGCFYIQSVDHIAGADELDLAVHPPPDLVIEVDITSPSLPRFPIYAALGVPEIWQYENERVRFFCLRGNDYEEAKESVALPRVTAEAVTEFVQNAKTMKRPQWLHWVRKWVRSLSSA